MYNTQTLDATQDKFEMEVFRGQLRRRNSNAIIAGHFGFVLEKNLCREITRLSFGHRFRKASFSKCFLSTAGVFKFVPFED